jgi:hypothetical protein
MELKCNWSIMFKMIVCGLDFPGETREEALKQIKALGAWLDEHGVARPWEENSKELKLVEPLLRKLFHRDREIGSPNKE